MSNEIIKAHENIEWTAINQKAIFEEFMRKMAHQVTWSPVSTPSIELTDKTERFHLN